MWAMERGLRAVADRARRGAEDRASQWELAANELLAKRQQETRQTREREAKEQQAKAEAERKQEHDRIRVDELDRTAVIKRYGSEAAVLAPCDREKLLKAAVRQWSKFCTRNEWTSSICSCRYLHSILIRKKPSTHVIDAISQAFPLPETLDGAIAEQAYWERRVRETALVRPGWFFDNGDLTIQIRQHVLRSLIDTMPARSVRDVLARLQGGDMSSEKLQEAVIADLKALSSATETVVTHEEFRAAQQKKEKPPVKQRTAKPMPSSPRATRRSPSSAGGRRPSVPRPDHRVVLKKPLPQRHMRP
jgi:hypothetical protein